MMNKKRNRRVISTLLTLVLLFVAASRVASAQTPVPTPGMSVAEATAKASLLLDQERYAEAVPYIAIIVKASPDDPDGHGIYGLALAIGSKQVSDPETAKKYSTEGLSELQLAKKLGSKRPEIDQLISILTGESPGASKRPGDEFFTQAEAAFARSEYAEALKLYKKALDLDPKNYQAALYMGDCYTSMQDWENAEKAYQAAIAIDPSRETAYRYSGTPLMKQKKYDAARDRYIEAYITEPYNPMSTRGINQWASITGAKVGHPEIDVPSFKYDAGGKPTTVMKEGSLAEGSKAWVAYSLTRDKWHKERFKAVFPKETAYRHSLQEETEALRETLKYARDNKLSHPHLELLQKIDNDGLLEAFVLLSTADDDLANEYPAYLASNRPKLRQYVSTYLIKK